MRFEVSEGSRGVFSERSEKKFTMEEDFKNRLSFWLLWDERRGKLRPSTLNCIVSKNGTPDPVSTTAFGVAWIQTSSTLQSSVWDSRSTKSSPLWQATWFVWSDPKLRMYRSYSVRGAILKNSYALMSNSTILFKSWNRFFNFRAPGPCPEGLISEFFAYAKDTIPSMSTDWRGDIPSKTVCLGWNGEAWTGFALNLMDTDCVPGRVSNEIDPGGFLFSWTNSKTN